MQELVVVTSCDIEFNDTLARVEALEVRWYLHGVPWVVDLCKEHRDTTPVTRMDEIAELYGRPLKERENPGKKPKRKPKGEGSSTAVVPAPGEPRAHCEYPDCPDMDGRGYANRNSLAAHYREAHPVSLSVWERQQRGEVPELKCEARGCREKFYTPQERGVHMRKKHGDGDGDE